MAQVVVCNPRRNALLKEGNQSDRVDARKLAELLRAGLLSPVYHGQSGVRRLKELARSYLSLTQDTTRVMNRLKALYRSWAIACRGQTVYAQIGNHRAAVSTLSPILDRRPPPPPEVFILVIGSALRAGDTAFAEHACDLGLRLYLNSDEIEQRCLRVVSMPFVEHLGSTLGGSAEDVPTLILMGRLLAEIAVVSDEATKQRCIKLLEKAVALSPAIALYNLGRGLRMLVRPEQAIPVLERALGAHPNEELQTLIWTQIGLAEQDLGHDARAENAFGRAFQLNRGLARHLVTSAFIFYTFLMAETKERQAAAVLGELLHRDSAFLPARMKHAEMLAEEGRMAEAAEEAELVARNADEENHPLIRAAHIFLLQLYKRMGRPEEAARHGAWLKNPRTASEP